MIYVLGITSKGTKDFWEELEPSDDHYAIFTENVRQAEAGETVSLYVKDSEDGPLALVERETIS